MTPETAIADRIVALNTAAAGRVYLLKVPQSAQMPAVRVQLVDDIGFPHLRGGGSGVMVARVQVDAYAREGSGTDPYAEAAALAAEIRGDDAGSGLSGFQGTVSGLEIRWAVIVNRLAMYEGEEQRLVRILQDCLVWYRPA